MLAGLQGLDGHPGVVGDGAIDVDRVDLGIFQEFAVIGVPLGDPVFLADLVQAFLIAPANRRDLGPLVTLVDRDELGSKPQADDCDPDWRFAGHRVRILLKKDEFPVVSAA